MTVSVRDGPSVEIRATARVSDFDIHVVVEGGFTPEQVTAIRAAAERWTDVIVGDKPDLVIPEDYQVPSHCEGIETLSPGTIDDFRVSLSMRPPGEGSRLAICEFRSTPMSREPVWIHYAMDENWLRVFGSDIQEGMTHHFGHLLGFGYFWSSFLRNPTTEEGPGADTHFVDPATIAAFDAAGGSDWTEGSKVPVENNPLRGPDFHWRLSVFGKEIMTLPTPVWGSNVPMSAITVQSMAALGYEVDVSMADPFVLLTAGAMAEWDLQAPGPGGWCFRGEPAEVIDDRGRVVGNCVPVSPCHYPRLPGGRPGTPIDIGRRSGLFASACALARADRQTPAQVVLTLTLRQGSEEPLRLPGPKAATCRGGVSSDSIPGRRSRGAA